MARTATGTMQVLVPLGPARKVGYGEDIRILRGPKTSLFECCDSHRGRVANVREKLAAQSPASSLVASVRSGRAYRVSLRANSPPATSSTLAPSPHSGMAPPPVFGNSGTGALAAGADLTSALPALAAVAC